ncbi:SGNH/GDSL hydrolase family protein [Paraburkholderia sp. SIMBA_030]
MTFPEVLSQILGEEVKNDGVGGQTSSQIAQRVGAIPIIVSVIGDHIPGNGAVELVKILNAPVSKNATLPGKLLHINGLLIRDVNEKFTFERLASGNPVKVIGGAEFEANVDVDANDRVIIWAGRNDRTQVEMVEANVADMVRLVRSKGADFIVISILNGIWEPRGSVGYRQISEINDSFAHTYGDHYLDVREWLVSQFDRRNLGDNLDHDADIPPRSLRSDGLHLNAIGYSRLGAFLASRLEESPSAMRR